MEASDVAHGSHEITCRDSVWLVSRLRDGELSADEVARLSRHVQGCLRCQTARRQFDALYAGLDDLLARANASQGALGTRPQTLVSPHLPDSTR